MIDYQAITDNLTLDGVKQLLTSLDIPFRETDSALIMPTVCHNNSIEDASWKLYYYKNTHIFYCYTECSEGMSIFKFLKKYYECRDIIYDWYTDIFEVVIRCSASKTYMARPHYTAQRFDYEPKKSRKELPEIPKGILDLFVKIYPIEWINDHITQRTMDKYDIKYSISQNKIIIPHYDIKGRLIGIRGRALNPYEIEHFGKYMPIQIEDKWYSHPLSLNLYGLNQTWENIKRLGVAYIFESEKSVLQAESFNLPNCGVACCGSNINKFQIDLLMRYCQPREIIVCLDNEEEPYSNKYFQKLWNMCKKYCNYCNMSFVYDRNNLTQHKDSPTDRGEKIFTTLLSERVRVK